MGPLHTTCFYYKFGVGYGNPEKISFEKRGELNGGNSARNQHLQRWLGQRAQIVLPCLDFFRAAMRGIQACHQKFWLCYI